MPERAKPYEALKGKTVIVGVTQGTFTCQEVLGVDMEHNLLHARYAVLMPWQGGYKWGFKEGNILLDAIQSLTEITPREATRMVREYNRDLGVHFCGKDVEILKRACGPSAGTVSRVSPVGYELFPYVDKIQGDKAHYVERRKGHLSFISRSDVVEVFTLPSNLDDYVEKLNREKDVEKAEEEGKPDEGASTP